MRGYSPAQAEICRVSVSNKANIPIHRANTLHSCSCDPQTSCCELVQELRAELARKDKVVENLTKRCKAHEEASQRQLSSGRSEGTLQQFAERCAQQILAAAQKRRSCSAEEIIDYRGEAYQQELEREIPDFSGFLRATLLATLSNRPRVKRDDDALRTTQTQVFCSMAKYATSEFQHPLRVADTWFMQIKTKDDLLTDIFNR